jgi:hypothetical protein
MTRESRSADNRDSFKKKAEETTEALRSDVPPLPRLRQQLLAKRIDPTGVALAPIHPGHRHLWLLLTREGQAATFEWDLGPSGVFTGDLRNWTAGSPSTFPSYQDWIGILASVLSSHP